MHTVYTAVQCCCTLPLWKTSSSGRTTLASSARSTPGAAARVCDTRPQKARHAQAPHYISRQPRRETRASERRTKSRHSRRAAAAAGERERHRKHTKGLACVLPARGIRGPRSNKPQHHTRGEDNKRGSLTKNRQHFPHAACAGCEYPRLFQKHENTPPHYPAATTHNADRTGKRAKKTVSTHLRQVQMYVRALPGGISVSVPVPALPPFPPSFHPFLVPPRPATRLRIAGTPFYRLPRTVELSEKNLEDFGVVGPVAPEGARRTAVIVAAGASAIAHQRCRVDVCWCVERRGCE